VAVLGGIILGGVVAVVLLVSRIKKRKEAIPFGPFLSLATIVTLIWGSGILEWYMGIFFQVAPAGSVRPNNSLIRYIPLPDDSAKHPGVPAIPGSSPGQALIAFAIPL